MRAARAAGCSSRRRGPPSACAKRGVELDALVGSASDAGEALDPAELDPAPRLVVRTEGASGGSWQARDGTSGRWEAEPPPGPLVDVYGCGDSFAAGLTCGLAAGLPLAEALRARRALRRERDDGRGPYGAQLGPEGWTASTRRSAS